MMDTLSTSGRRSGQTCTLVEFNSDHQNLMEFVQRDKSTRRTWRLNFYETSLEFEISIHGISNT